MLRENVSAGYKNFVGGKWKETSTGRYVPNTNPANKEEVLGKTPLSSAAEAIEAVDVAMKTFPSWSEVPWPVRGNYLFKLVRIMEKDKENLARLLTLEEGKTIKESTGEVQKAINVVEFIAGESRRASGETTPSEMPATFAYTIRQPLGVVALITPWNFPVAIPAWKIAPAIVAGNTVVFKPATLTPATAARFVELVQEAGVPDGVVNLVFGSGGEVGNTLVEDKRVKAVSFTGSNEIGSRIYALGAKRGIKVQCEMGGKNPVVVLADADLDLASEGTVQGAFGSTGQRCTATSRAIVIDSVADEFLNLVLKKTRMIKTGPGTDPANHMGPSVDESQFKTVLSYIDIGKKEGAKLILGGNRLTTPPLDKGNFVEPTIFDHVRPEMRIAKEEIFGPVLAVIRVKSLDEAIEVANNVEFGLSSSIYTNDECSSFRFIDKIETGMTHVNSPTVGGEAQLPFGGIKGTGVGHREQGKTAIEFYTELKTVYIDYTGKKRDTNIY